MKTKIFIVGESDAGLRIDKWLTQIEEISSRSFAQDLISKNLVLVDNVVVKASALLKLNQTIEIHFPDAKPVGLIPYDHKLDILFEDNDLLIINKPSGLVVHPAAGHEQDTLVNALVHYTQQLSMKNELRPGIVHRLDKETSGLLVVAKNDFTHEKLADQFKNKTSHRIYYAIAEKEIKLPFGVIQSFLARHPVDRKRHSSVRVNKKIVSKFDADFLDGKWAVTHFKKLAVSHADKNLFLTYTKLKLETGRTHQIRVHLSENGNPLLGDVTYGASQVAVKKFHLQRFYLHAAELGFVHPRTEEKMLFKVGWPAQDVLKLIELGFSRELPGM